MSPVSTVIGVNSDISAYGKLNTFTITGSNLPSSPTATATGCTGLTMLAASSTTSRQFTCTPEGTSVVVAVNYGAASPYTTTLSIAAPQVTIVTSLGSVIVELYPDKAPISVKNFLAYVDTGFYSNTVFHRVVPGFVTQGGGFVSDAVNTVAQKANSIAPISLESNNGLTNLKYTLAMARQTAPNTATSQFYFNAANNSGLDYNSAIATANGYAVFGKAIVGTAVLDSMNAVANATLTSGTFVGLQNVPTTALVLQSAVRTK